MNLGKERRLRRIFREDRKTVIVPMDHGISIGPVTGLINMQETMNNLSMGGVDAVIIHKGIAKNVDVKRMGLIIHLSASTELCPDPNWKVQMTSVKQAIKMGADGVSIHINIGASNECNMLVDMGKIADECEDFGMPLLAMMYPRGPNIKNSHDVDLVKHIARLGAELGADVVKTNYTGSLETFREVVKGCPVPVVIAGGSKAKTDEDLLKMVLESIQEGGVGVSIGRNVFQDQKTTLMVKALSAIVHNNSTIEDALRILGEGR